MPSYLVTGASRGIGRALSQLLIEQGHRVFGLARSAESVAGLGLTGTLLLELSDLDAFADALRPLLDELGADGLDGLVHCAGIVRAGPLADSTSGDLLDQVTVNAIAVAELTRLCLPALRLASGSVVLVNSGSGLNARPPLAGYAMSKFALHGYADALRQEEPRLRVASVFAGRTATDMQRVVRRAEDGTYDESQYLAPTTVAGVIASVLALPADATVTDLTLRPAGQPGPASPDAHS